MPKQATEKRKAIPKKIRGEAWKIQFADSTKGECFCCKKVIDVFENWHAGHIKSYANGGSDTADNLRPVCGSCNLSMGTENMDDFKARFYPNTVMDGKKEKISQLVAKGVLTACPGCEKQRDYLGDSIFSKCDRARIFENLWHCDKCNYHCKKWMAEECPCLTA